MSKKEKLIKTIVADLQEGGPIHQAMKDVFGLVPLVSFNEEALHDLKAVKEAFDKHDAEIASRVEIGDVDVLYQQMEPGMVPIAPLFFPPISYDVELGREKARIARNGSEYFDPKHNVWLPFQDSDAKRIRAHGYKTRRVFVEIPKQELGKPTIL